MNQIALVLCAGRELRWNNYGGIPKQLIRVDRESLIERTSRLVRENGISLIVLVTRNPKIKLDDAMLFSPENDEFILDTLKSTRMLWKDKTLVLLGDVWYSEETMRKIISFKGPCGIFGRRKGSLKTGSPYREIFAFVFRTNAWSHINLCINNALLITGDNIHHRGKLWSLYIRLVNGTDSFALPGENVVFQEINDFTEDFDSPKEYYRWVKNYNAGKLGKGLLLPKNCFHVYVDCVLLWIKKWLFRLGLHKFHGMLIKVLRKN